MVQDWLKKRTLFSGKCMKQVEVGYNYLNMDDYCIQYEFGYNCLVMLIHVTDLRTELSKT